MPSLVVLFNACKQIITSPLLLWYDSSKSVFLKTNWSTGGMGYILIKANESPQSLAVLKLLKETVECTFNILLDGPWLRPMLFGSQSNQTFIKHYQTFVGEVSCGRW